MKNLNPHQTKKAIFVELKKFKEDVSKAMGEDVEVFSDLDNGLIFERKDDFDSGHYGCYLEFETVIRKLEEYYNITISSIHLDEHEIIGVWICYKDIS